MFRTLRALCLALGLLITLWTPLAHGQADAGVDAPDAGQIDAGDGGGASFTPPPKKKLVVVPAGSPPFVLEGKGGLSLDVWREVAKRANLEFQLEKQASVASAIEGVNRHQADVAIGPISITAPRLRQVRFTQPYFRATLGIVGARQDDAGGALKWLGMLGLYLGGFVLSLFVVGALLWVVERKQNPEQFPESFLRGVSEGAWCALATATTVGYGDRAPATGAGRIIAGVWMLITLIGISSLTAAIASLLTVRQLESGKVLDPAALRGQKVAAVAGTTGAQFAQNNGARLIPVKSLQEGVQQVAQGRAFATVADRPQLQYYIQQNPDSPVTLAPGGYEPQGYGFAVSDANLQRQLDIALVEITQDGTLLRLRQEYLGAE